MRALLSVDIHDRAEALVAMVQPWLTALGATVDLVYVSDYVLTHPYAPHGYYPMEPGWEKIRARERSDVNALFHKLQEDLRGDWYCPDGRPGTVIPELAERYDMVIVGTHGRTGLARVWMGSVAEKIVRSCGKPVLVLRLDDPDEADAAKEG